MSVKITTVLGGAPNLIRQLQLANPRTAARVRAVVKAKTEEVLVAAVARAPKRSGVMAGTGRAEYSKDGMVGFVKFGRGKLPRRSKSGTVKGQKRATGRAKTTGPGAFAPVIDRGDPRRHIKAQRFLSDPFTHAKPGVIKDIDHALSDSVNEI